jgi:hypothetical protein
MGRKSLLTCSKAFAIPNLIAPACPVSPPPFTLILILKDLIFSVATSGCITKENDKVYFRHTGYPGGVKETKYSELIQKFPERIVENAVKGMLPHNRLGRKILLNLKVYKGKEHPHLAQQPKPLKI